MSNNKGMTITEFLEARISEDEAGAKATTPGRWFRDSGWSISAPAPEGWDGPYVVVETPRARNDSEFVARHNPARVLAECAAKRAIIKACERLEDQRIDGNNWDMDRTDDLILNPLAAIYSDHSDYRQEWIA